MREEVGIGLAARPAVPFDFDRAGHAADKVQFRFCAYIDEARTGIGLQQGVGFSRQQCAGVCQSHLLAALAGFA